jgi:hypothetical protein
MYYICHVYIVKYDTFCDEKANRQQFSILSHLCKQKILTTYFYSEEALMDYPDSPARDGEVTVPADPSLLDTEDGNYLRDQLDGNRHPDNVPGFEQDLHATAHNREASTGRQCNERHER